MKEEQVQKITVAGERFAKPGEEFFFVGEMPECRKCRFRGTCLNLEPGRKYRIESVREGHLMECALHDGGVLAVHVTPAPIKALVDPKKAVAGSTVVYEPVAASVSEEDEKYLAPEGLVKGDRCRIVDIGDTIKAGNRSYRIVSLVVL